MVSTPQEGERLQIQISAFLFPFFAAGKPAPERFASQSNYDPQPGRSFRHLSAPYILLTALYHRAA